MGANVGCGVTLFGPSKVRVAHPARNNMLKSDAKRRFIPYPSKKFRHAARHNTIRVPDFSRHFKTRAHTGRFGKISAVLIKHWQSA
jgi:hypothetical protein